MTNKDLADLIFKDLSLTYEDCIKKYPKRNLPKDAIVTRFAPSPTGFIHMGSLYATFIEGKTAKQSNGVFILRIDDTDTKRSVDNGIQKIIKSMKDFNIEFDEYPISETEEVGNYGPYIQTKRKDIYQAFVKHFIERGLAYPCFCTEQELSDLREHQRNIKDRLGYYGKYAKCRNLSIDEAYKRIQNGEAYVIRFKSPGDYNKKIIVDDLIKGKIEFPENDKDEVILKSTDGLPTYHFAHLVDDVLMDTTHIVRGVEWLPSTPLHMQLFTAYGVTPPKYAHFSPINKKDGDSIRKLSKRKDVEAAASYYHEVGIPSEAVMIYIATIVNSNFEAWYDCNKDKTLDDFILTYNKISASGPLFDIEKLNSISKDYISRMKARDLYDNLLKWCNEFDKDFASLITKYKDYTINILNIEREQKKPRKDFICYKDIKSYIWYMFNELFDKKDLTYDWQLIKDKSEIINILDKYITKYYDSQDDKDTWFNKMKELCIELNFSPNVKEYKENPDKYKGSIIDISTVIRVALTTKSMTPDLYEIMNHLGKDTIIKRINILREK